ncbi:MAG: hypothetical protein NW214_07170 [Pseudanabaenaceae cyanobacterium bins.39]|nr:hypothetical protein [Pseudanabaenaceae cyanobacterium bins.39]
MSVRINLILANGDRDLVKFNVARVLEISYYRCDRLQNIKN